MRACALALLSGWLFACGNCGEPAQPQTSREQSSAPAPEKPPAPTRTAEQEAAAAIEAAMAADKEKKPWPRPGWSAIALQDQVPICVFADYETRHKANLIEEVKQLELNADASIVIGAFAAWCVNEA